MKIRFVTALATVLLAFAAAARADNFLAGVAFADEKGNGTVVFRIDPAGDDILTADSIRDNVVLTTGHVKKVTVDAGVARVVFVDATPEAQVGALLPEDIANDEFEMPSTIGESALLKKHSVIHGESGGIMHSPQR